MSLASSVSHYGSDTAVKRFEKYKCEVAVMKRKYLAKEISEKDFIRWIDTSKCTK